MGIGHFERMALLALPALALLSGCGQLIGKNDDNAKPQAVMASPGSGGRNEAANPAASPSPSPAAVTAASSVDFGDDASKFSRDGECDDKRFSGAGMTNTPLLESDIGHDASDCRAAFNQGRLKFGAAQEASSGYADSGVDHIQWGDDASKFSRDGECDDKRFEGAGLTSTPLLDSDVQHDATDCRAAYRQGRLKLRE